MKGFVSQVRISGLPISAFCRAVGLVPASPARNRKPAYSSCFLAPFLFSLFSLFASFSVYPFPSLIQFFLSLLSLSVCAYLFCLPALLSFIGSLAMLNQAQEAQVLAQAAILSLLVNLKNSFPFLGFTCPTCTLRSLNQDTF